MNDELRAVRSDPLRQFLPLTDLAERRDKARSPEAKGTLDHILVLVPSTELLIKASQASARSTLVNAHATGAESAAAAAPSRGRGG